MTAVIKILSRIIVAELPIAEIQGQKDSAQIRDFEIVNRACAVATIPIVNFSFLSSSSLFLSSRFLCASE